MCRYLMSCNNWLSRFLYAPNNAACAANGSIVFFSIVYQRLIDHCCRLSQLIPLNLNLFWSSTWASIEFHTVLLPCCGMSCGCLGFQVWSLTPDAIGGCHSLYDPSGCSICLSVWSIRYCECFSSADVCYNFICWTCDDYLQLPLHSHFRPLQLFLPYCPSQAWFNLHLHQSCKNVVVTLLHCHSYLWVAHLGFFCCQLACPVESFGAGLSWYWCMLIPSLCVMPIQCVLLCWVEPLLLCQSLAVLLAEGCQ